MGTHSTLVDLNLLVSEVGHLLERIHRDQYRTNVGLFTVKETSTSGIHYELKKAETQIVHSLEVGNFTCLICSLQKLISLQFVNPFNHP